MLQNKIDAARSSVFSGKEEPSHRYVARTPRNIPAAAAPCFPSYGNCESAEAQRLSEDIQLNLFETHVDARVVAVTPDFGDCG
jgi:hypothetical protein